MGTINRAAFIFVISEGCFLTFNPCGEAANLRWTFTSRCSGLVKCLLNAISINYWPIAKRVYLNWQKEWVNVLWVRSLLWWVSKLFWTFVASLQYFIFGANPQSGQTPGGWDGHFHTVVQYFCSCASPDQRGSGVWNKPIYQNLDLPLLSPSNDVERLASSNVSGQCWI